MAKVTEQDVINFLTEKVAQISRDLEFVKNTLNVIQGTSIQNTAPRRGRKPGTSKNTSSMRTKTAKVNGAKRGRKPKSRDFPSERIMAADQLG